MEKTVVDLGFEDSVKNKKRKKMSRWKRKRKIMGESEGWVGIAAKLSHLLFEPPKRQQRKDHSKAWESKNVRKRKTYMEDVASKHRKSDEENINKWQSNSSKDANRDWNKVVICIRDNYKAAFVCNDNDVAEMLGRKKTLFINGSYTVRLQGWHLEDASLNKKISFTGGWIEIEDLQLQWWKKDIFEAVGDKCRGLLEVDSRMEFMSQIFIVKIMGKGNDWGFIPVKMDMRIDKSRFTIKLKAQSRLNLTKMRVQKMLPNLDEFKRCVIEMGEEDDGIHEEENNVIRNNYVSYEKSNVEGERTDKGENGDEGGIKKDLPLNQDLIKVTDIFRTLYQGLDYNRNNGNNFPGSIVAVSVEREPVLYDLRKAMKSEYHNQFKKGEISRDNGLVRLFNNKPKGRRIIVLRGEDDLSVNSDADRADETKAEINLEG
ncbi:hypothetical protein LguiB_021897 [Lonicera macranthoides]